MGGFFSHVGQAVDNIGKFYEDLTNGLDVIVKSLASGIKIILDSTASVFSFVGAAFPYTFTIGATILGLIGIIYAETLIDK